MNFLSTFVPTLIAFAFLFTACKDEKTPNNGLQEVRLDDKMSNKDIIRNPISANAPTDTLSMAHIAFEGETIVNFGTIKEGAVINHNFKFKNTGKTALLITDVQSTCGCTVAEYNKKSIAPEATDEIKVTFNSEGKVGIIEKPVTIYSNAFPSKSIVKLVGEVTKK